MLCERCHRHYNTYYDDHPPSKGPYRKDEPDGWRCKTWDEVARRCGSLDVIGGHRQLNGEATELVVSNGRSTPPNEDATSPNTRPRTLELYAGRGVWSAGFVRQGCDSW